MAVKTDNRRREILHVVNAFGVAYVVETAKRFGVTTETIRSDFDYLARQHSVTRIHGGIKKDSSHLFSQPYKYNEKKLLRVEEKKRICFHCAELVENGDVLYLDSGSTVSYLIDFLQRKSDLTIVTPSIALLVKYVLEDVESAFRKNRNRLILTGGEVNASILTTHGTFFNSNVTDLHFDKLLFSADGVDLQRGCSDADEVSYSTLKAVAERSTRNILLADSSKFERVANYHVMNWEQIDVLLSDRNLDETWQRQLASQQVEIVNCG